MNEYKAHAYRTVESYSAANTVSIYGPVDTEVYK